MADCGGESQVEHEPPSHPHCKQSKLQMIYYEYLGQQLKGSYSPLLLGG